MADSLLRRVAAGDPDAIEAVLDRYGPLVGSLARRLTRTRTDADDATQEIFIDLWRSAHRFDEQASSEKTFVAMIARRRLIDRLRKQQRSPEPSVLPDDLTAAIPNPIRRLELSDEAAQVAEAFAELRPEQQRVLKLSILQGLTHSQIAELTGEPLGTVKTHARRGLLRLRDLLGAAPTAGGPPA